MSDEKLNPNLSVTPIPKAPTGVSQSEFENWCRLPLSEHAAKIETISGQERVGALEALIARLLQLLDDWQISDAAGPLRQATAPFTIGHSQPLYWDQLLHRNGADDGFDPRWALYRTALRLTQILGEERAEKNIPIACLVDRWPVLLDRLPGRRLKNGAERVRPSEAKQAELHPIRRTALRTLDTLDVGSQHLFPPGHSKRDSVRGLLLRTYLTKVYALQKRPQNSDIVRWAENLGERALGSRELKTGQLIEAEDWRNKATALPLLSPASQEAWIDVILLAIKADHPSGLLDPSRWESVEPAGYEIWDTVRGIVQDKAARRFSGKTYDPNSKQGQQDILDALRIELRHAMKTHLNL